MKIKTPLFAFSTINISLNCFADVNSIRIFFSFERDLIPFHESHSYLKKKKKQKRCGSTNSKWTAGDFRDVGGLAA